MNKFPGINQKKELTEKEKKRKEKEKEKEKEKRKRNKGHSFIHRITETKRRRNAHKLAKSRIRRRLRSLDL
jgi:hypothetical protein